MAQIVVYAYCNRTIARDHADRVLGVIALNTPYTRRAKVDLLEAVRQARGTSHYMVTFQEPGVGEPCWAPKSRPPSVA